MNRHGKLPLILAALLLCVLALLKPGTAYGQAGVLLPSGNSTRPDPNILSLAEMTVQVNIDNQFARVRVMQIYTNHTANILEGKYIFLIPTSAAISDFAVWDGDVRIPGVIIEKRRANEIYEEITRQNIDPGILQTEEGEAAFSTKIAPIPPFSTKRLEMEYTQVLPVDGLKSYFSFPLRPSDYGQQLANAFRVELSLASKFRIANFNLISKQYPLSFSRRDERDIVASYEASTISFQEDFAVEYSLNVPRSQLEFLAYRAPEQVSALELRDPARANPNPDGYFEAATIFSGTGSEAGKPAAPRSVVLMLDTSLSMRWEKLDKSIEAIEYFLSALTPQDSFNLVLFNDDINTLSEAPVKGSRENVTRALDFIRNSYLSGGTELQAALRTALAAANRLPKGDRAIVLITDGNSTLGSTAVRKIVSSFNQANQNIARMFVFGIGNDTKTELLSELVRASNGYFTWARETESLDYKLGVFFEKIGKPVIEGITFNAADSNNFYHVYPDVDRVSYDGSRFAFVGRYRRPGDNAAISVDGKQRGQIIQLTETVKLPELDTTHDHLPRQWARARVDALLREIALNGESEALINEIIALSKKYKFVTPYTAFLAAPRSLLRPRIIKPGDPVLRVRTDKSIVSVVAIFPFGLSKTLTYLNSDDIWETRFLAPKTMQDGSYSARLILTDAQGRAYQEEKSFVIDSRPPTLKAELSEKTVQAGRDLIIKVRADRDTRRISARLFGALPVPVVWSEKEHINIGRLHIPEGLPAGTYQLLITAEDFAHNSTSIELLVEVLGL
ncbi:MAG: VIT and VWA domain-containing protein [Acidobacteriota bacterium]